MSEAAIDAGTPATRSSTVSSAVQFGVLFLLAGPLIATLAFAVMGVGGELLAGRPEGFKFAGNLIVGMPFLAIVGYLAGGLPALAAGVIVGILDRWLRDWRLYPASLLVGAAPGLVFGGAGRGDWEPVAWIAAIGAITVLSCTAMARHVGLGRV